MKEPVYIKLFLDYLDAVDALSDVERGRLFTALLKYGRTGEAPQLTGNERFIFPMMKAQIDRDFASWREKDADMHENRKEAGRKGGLASASKRKQNQANQANASKAKQTKQKTKTKTKTTDNDEGLLTNDELDSSCAEPSTTPHAPSVPPVFQVPLNDKTFFDVTADMMARWKELYPAVNVEQSMRDIVGWCEANPKQRKTRNGAMRFLNAWMAREQDKGGKGYQNRASGGYNGNQGGYDWRNDPAYQGVINHKAGR